MIVTVTLNAALDVTYHVRDVAWGESNRVGEIGARAGGKGINVAAVLAALGHDVAATGFLAGRTGEAIRTHLASTGITDAFLRVDDGESRRTVTVNEVDTGRATLFNEPGAAISGDDWHRLLARTRDVFHEAEAVVLSGSLPPGLPDDAHASLTEGVPDETPLLIDSSGEALRHAAKARPALVTPNHAELAAMTGEADARSGATALRDVGAQAVVVTLGTEGMFASTPDGSWRAYLPTPVHGNPVGAGDAAVAALASGLGRHESWPDLLTCAVALSAAAVCCPAAGDVDLDTYHRLLDDVRVEPD